MSGSGDRSGPRVLVYAGPAALPGCPEAAARAVRHARPDAHVRLVRGGWRPWSDGLGLDGADLYVQPGGGELAGAWRSMRRHRRAIRSWVADGGRYLGFCLGAYLAGSGPGFGLLPGDSGPYITSRTAVVRGIGDQPIPVTWRGRERTLFFQDGAMIELDDTGDAEILARYPRGEVAAAVVGYGAGRVGVVGPHPEADASWFTDAGLVVPPDTLDLATDLVSTVLA